VSENGTGNLVAAHPGNVNAVRHGLWSDRVLEPRVQEVADTLMELPHAIPIDRLAAEECARLIARIERIDADLDERGHFGRSGARSLLQHRARLSKELRSWLEQFGATPKSRAQWARTMAMGGVAAEMQRRLAEMEGRAGE
jgi:hypothetical protein